MSIAETTAIERIARVLAGRRLSINGDGDEAGAAKHVDSDWSNYKEDAIAILKALREPDARMASAGEVGIWTKMIGVALGETSVSPGNELQEIYQKPLG